MRSLQLSRGSQEERQIKYKKAFLSDKSFSLCFFKWEVSLLDWIKMADLSAEQPQSTQLWRALLFPSSSSRCCWDQSTPVKASLWWKRTHIKTCMNASRWQMQRNSPAHSECCCLSGLCSAPAVTSSLCLCCRWCTSSLGCPSFCWRGTFLLFPLPGESERSQLYVKLGQTLFDQKIWLLSYFQVMSPKTIATHWKSKSDTSRKRSLLLHSQQKPNTATNPEWEMIDCLETCE